MSTDSRRSLSPVYRQAALRRPAFQPSACGMRRSPRTVRQCIAVLCVLAITAATSRLARAEETWPALPEKNGAVEIPAQEWPLRPGPRTVRVLVHYPDGTRASVTAKTGLMLTLHNWGGVDCVGTADPSQLAQRLNVVALCVNYLQSGPKDSIEGPEPYDFGYLQALDALRALYWVFDGLKRDGREFAAGRIYCTGGSGGGNVTLMANKLAPRTFACVVDLCGMKKLTDDIAFNLPGGSGLNARYRQDPQDAYRLSLDDQELRFIGNPDHLRVMKELGANARIVTVHGVQDTTCPYSDAVEMVDWMRRVSLPVEPWWVRPADLDGSVFTSANHSLGNRTGIVFRVAGTYLAPDRPEAIVRAGKTDFERREQVRYPTTNGQFVVSYVNGFPVGRFETASPLPDYPDHSRLLEYRDSDGTSHPVASSDDWQRRRTHIVRQFERVAGRLPSPLRRVPLDVKVVEETRVGKLVRRKLTFQSDPHDRVPAYLFLPEELASLPAPDVDSTRPAFAAVLCLQQTTAVGKDEPAGVRGDPSLKYALELAERGFVTLAPDYPSFGEHAYDFAADKGYVSGTMKAVWDNIRAVDLLEATPGVDARRIGCIGHSLGGHSGLFTAVFDERIRALVTSCGFSTLRKDDVPSWTGPRYMPRIASEFGNDARRVPFEFDELAASVAPRALFVSAATRDSDFDVSGVRDVITSARQVYSLFGAESKLVAHYPDAPHSFPDESRRAAYEFLDQQLRAP